MKAFCEHHQPWFRCGQCEAERREAELLVAARRFDPTDFWYRRLAGMSMLPALSCLILD